MILKESSFFVISHFMSGLLTILFFYFKIMDLSTSEE